MGRFSRQYSSNARFREASGSPPLSMKSLVGQGMRHEGTGDRRDRRLVPETPPHNHLFLLNHTSIPTASTAMMPMTTK